jgi:ABC-type Fe3+ transport system substrate-binding protein
VTNGGLAPAVFKRPPNPNATKVFINWALSREAQELFARQLLQQPTRKDVQARDAFDKPVPGVTYFHTQLEESMETATREAQRLARELIP